MPAGVSTPRINRWHLDASRPCLCPAHFGEHVSQQMPQRAEVIQRYGVVYRQAILLPDLAKELSLADAVDPQICLQIGVHFYDLARITRLLDDKVDQKRF